MPVRTARWLDRRAAFQAAPVKVSSLCVLLLLLAAFSFGVGRLPIDVATVVRILGSRLLPIEKDWTDAMETIVLQVRGPRILAAILVGAALAAAGAAYQTLFRNPLVSPSVLGVSAGAGFGASLGVILDASQVVLQGLAFLFGLLAVGLALLIGRQLNRHSMVILVLAGMVVGALFQALISILKIVADPVDVLPAITFWLLGGLNRITLGDLPVAAASIALGLLLLHLHRWDVNVLGTGADEARAVGIDVGRTRLVVVAAATLITAAAVSVSGIVGWVGLLVPHMARMLVGPAFHHVLPMSIVLGSGYLLAVDNVCRGVGPMEIPLGILTAVIGAPLFVLLLARARVAWL